MLTVPKHKSNLVPEWYKFSKSEWLNKWEITEEVGYRPVTKLIMQQYLLQQEIFKFL